MGDRRGRGRTRDLAERISAAAVRGLAAQIIDAGLVPIVEPEVDIHCPEKAEAEAALKPAILEKLNQLPAGHLVMLKLTLPEQEISMRISSNIPKSCEWLRCQVAIREKKPTTACAEITALSPASRGRLQKGSRPSNPMLSSTPCWTNPFKVFSKRPTPRHAMIWSGMLWGGGDDIAFHRR
jgi:hypothetical protein